MTILSANSIFEHIKNEFPGKDYLISLSHRSYLDFDGGIEHCIRMESKIAILKNLTYIHLHPNQSFGNSVSVTINDRHFGNVLLDGLSFKLSHHPQCMTIIHSAINFNQSQFLRFLLSISKNFPIVHWLHDLSFACDSVSLIDSFDENCNIPKLHSDRCKNCRHEHSRPGVHKYYTSISNFVNFQIFPTETAKNRYNKFFRDDNHLKKIDQLVIPHFISKSRKLNINHELKNPDSINRKINFAFVGHSVHHKGWGTYLELTSRLDSSNFYNFYHIGTRHNSDSKISFIPFSEKSHSNPEFALTQIIDKYQIDIVLFWPIAFESFGILHRQILRSRAAVIIKADDHALLEYIDDFSKHKIFHTFESMLEFCLNPIEVFAFLNAAQSIEFSVIESLYSFSPILTRRTKKQTLASL